MAQQTTTLTSDSHADKSLSAWWVVSLAYAILALLFTLGAAFPVYASWGFSIWSIFGKAWGIAIPIAVAVLLSPLCVRPISTGAVAIAEKVLAISRPIGKVEGFSLGSALLLCLFFFLRSRALVYGDGILMPAIFSEEPIFQIASQGYLQIGSLIFNRLMVRILMAVFPLDPQAALSLLNATGGVIAFWGLWAVARVLGRDSRERGFLLLAALAGGTTLLFFGHVENYTWQTAFALWTVYFALRYLRDGRGLAPLITMSVLTILWHAVTLPFLMVAVLAVWMSKRESGNFALNIRHSQAMIGVSVLLFVAMVLLQLSGLTQGVFRFVFVPVWPIESNPYSAFSWVHLVDMANLLIFLAPVGLVALLLSLIQRKRNASIDKLDLLFAWLALLTFWVSFWIDPLIGAVRDWDLLSFVGIPLSLFGAYRLLRRVNFRAQSTTLVFSAGLVLVLNLVPHMYEEADSKRALARVDSLVWESPHYQATYDAAYRSLPWGTMLANSFEEYGLAKPYLYRCLSANDTSGSSWFNLGQIYVATNAVDSAGICFERAVRFDPMNPHYLMKRAEILARQGRPEEALQYVSLSEQINPSDPRLYMTKGIIHGCLRQDDEALFYFRKSFEQAPERFDENFNLGTFFLSRKQYDSAAPYLQRALSVKPELVSAHERLILAQLGQGREHEAAATLARLREIRPTGPDLTQYRKMLER